MEKQCKKVSLLGIVILLWAINLSAQGPDTLWTKTYGGTRHDMGYSVQETSDGGYIIAGMTESFGAGDTNVYLIKTDAKGDTLWTKTYGGDTTDVGFSVQQTFDGGYIVAGGTESFGAGDRDIYLIKTDAKGDTLWTRTYGDTAWEEGYSVQQTSDGGYIVAGGTASFSAGGKDLHLIKTDAKGDVLWTRTYGGEMDDLGYSVRQTSDEGYIIAGYANREYAYLVKIDAKGDFLWAKLDGDGFPARIGRSVQQTSDNGYIVAGYVVGEWGDTRIYLIKTNAAGDILWTRQYVGGGSFSVQETFDGGYIVVGGRIGDVYLMKIASNNGDTLWTKTYGGTDADVGYSIQQTSDDGYIIAGCTRSFGAGDYDVYLIKTRPSLKLISPNGGEVLVGNTIHHIIWFPEGTKFDSYRLLYSIDGGETYPYIIADRISPNSRLYSWKIPEIDCNTCRVKVQIRDMKGYVIEEDESDSNFTIQSTGIEERESLPKTFFVSSIESPWRDRTLIKYGLPKSSNVHIVIYNLLGQEIRKLLNRKQNAGTHTIIWDGRDNSGERVSSGVYFLRFEGGGYKATRKLLIMR